MNYKLTLDRMEKLSGQIGLVQNRIAELANSKTELKTSVDLAISQSDQPGADPEIGKSIEKISGIDAELKKQNFILDSLQKELDKLPIADSLDMKEFDNVHSEYLKICKDLNAFADQWNAGIESLDKMAKDKFPVFGSFLNIYERLNKLGRKLKIDPDLHSKVKYNLWNAIDQDVDCPFRLWRLLSRIPKNGERWLNRRIRGGNLIETEN